MFYIVSVSVLGPTTRQQILDSSKLKEFADDNIKFDENGGKLSKWVENTVGKGEIARYEQFLLFPQCFQKGCFPWASKGVIVWEWVNSHSIRKCTLTLYHTISTFHDCKMVMFCKHCGNQHFLLFPQCFQPFTKQIPIFHEHILSSAKLTPSQKTNLDFQTERVCRRQF